MRARLMTGSGPDEAELGGLAVHALRGRIDDVDGQQGVILDDGDAALELSEVFGHREDIIRGYELTAAVLLARAAMLKAEGPDRNRGET